MISSGKPSGRAKPDEGGGEATVTPSSSPTLIIDTQSEPGAYAKLIREGSIRATEHEPKRRD